MIRRAHVGLAALMAFGLSAGAARAQGDSLSLELFDDHLEIQQLTPGARVAVLSAERQPVRFTTRTEILVRATVDSDADGTAVLELPNPPAESSVWLAIEGRTGRFGIVSPLDGAPFAFASPLGLAPDPRTGGQVVGVDGHSRIQLLLVRRNVGIWKAEAADGGLAEGTGIADGRILLLEPDWEPAIGTEPPPEQFESSDVLVALDPDTFAIDAQVYGGLNALP